MTTNESNPLFGIDGNSTSKKWKYTGASLLFGLCLVGSVIGIYYSGNEIESVSHVTDIDKALALSGKISLPYKGGISLEDEKDVYVEIEKLNDLILRGTLYYEQKPTTKFDLNLKENYMEFQRTYKDHSEYFYTSKGLTRTDHYLQLNEHIMNAKDYDESQKRLQDFYTWDLLVDIIQISLRIGAKGYTGKDATSVSTLHGLARHFVTIDTVKERIPTNFKTNKRVVNNYIQSLSKVLPAPEPKTKKLIHISPDEFEMPEYSYCLSYKHKCKTESKCDNDCFGMCGDGCDCWDWVCGDCLCHCKCEDHDNICSCYGLTEYYCWAIWDWATETCD